MTDQVLAKEVLVERTNRPPGQPTNSPQCWPETRAGFRVLVESFQDQLVRHAFRRLGSFQDAEDVVQEVFVRAYARAGHGAKVKSVVAYLYGMTANACTDALRKRKHAGVPLDAEQSERIRDNRHNAYEKAVALEEVRKVEALLRQLPRRQAEVIGLRVFDGLRFAEVAEVVGCSEATAKSRFRYGLQRLRTLVTRDSEAKP